MERENGGERLSLLERAREHPDLWWPTKQDLVVGTETIYRSPIEGAWLILEKKYEDERGSFTMAGRNNEIKEAIGQPFVVAQMSLSESKEGVIRGIHFEDMFKWIKPIDSVLTVLVDGRKDSMTFGKKLVLLLGNRINFGMDEKRKTVGSIFIVSGIGNSFMGLEGVRSEPEVDLLVRYFYAVGKTYSEVTAEEKVPLYLLDETVDAKWPVEMDVKKMIERGLISDRDLPKGEYENGTSLRWKEFVKFREENGLV